MTRSRFAACRRHELPQLCPVMSPEDAYVTEAYLSAMCRLMRNAMKHLQLLKDRRRVPWRMRKMIARAF